MGTDPVPVNMDTAKEGFEYGEGMVNSGLMEYHVVKGIESSKNSFPSWADLLLKWDKSNVVYSKT